LVKPVAKPPEPAAVLKPKRIVGLTGPGVARIDGDVAGDTPMRIGLGGAGDVIIGLNPPLSSSVAPSGIPLRPTDVRTPPFADDGVPDAVPVVGVSPQVAGELIAPELRPEGMALEHGLLLAVGSNGAGLSPLGESEVAPNGIPTGPMGDVAPSIPSGDVSPIAGLFGEGGANWAILAPQPRSSMAEAVSKARTGTSVDCPEK
jgi:hypothetical protein